MSLRRRIAFLLAASIAPTAWSADLLVDHVNGYTLDASGTLQRFEAMLVDDGKVVATGERATMRARAEGAKVVDGQGRTLLPGLIDAHGHVKLLEVGLMSSWWETAAASAAAATGSSPTASMERRVVDPDAIGGFHPYQSPEQIRGERVDHRTDIFSIGALLYEIIVPSTMRLEASVSSEDLGRSPTGVASTSRCAATRTSSSRARSRASRPPPIR